MAWNTYPYAVTNTPTLVVGSAAGWIRRAVINNTGATPVWIGDNNVFAGQGRLVLPGELVVHDGPDELYAVTWNNARIAITESYR